MRLPAFTLGTPGLAAGLVLLSLAQPAMAQVSRPSVCAMIYKPVCAGKTGRLKTYGNVCLAARDGAVVVADGRCPLMCGTVFAPVCAHRDGRRRTHGNACMARIARASIVHTGRCAARASLTGE
jgi:hypothetical protein